MLTAEWINVISKFFENNLIARVIFDSYFVLIIISFVVYLAIKFKKALFLTILGLIIGVITWFSHIAGLTVSNFIYPAILSSYIVISFIILAPEIRKHMEFHKGENANKVVNVNQTAETIEAVADAVFDMAAVKTGALITIEQHISLEQYSERAISLNSDVSKEVLEQIFIKNTPLHDGGVIIRGNRIICAAAYYTLTQETSLDKTTGSRHRAGIGISEMTDSLTIIVSEETGQVDVANQGFMKKIETKNDLIEYLNTYLGKN